MKLFTILSFCLLSSGFLKSQNITHAMSFGLTHTGLDVDLTHMEGTERNEGFKNSKLGYGLNYTLDIPLIKRLSAISGLEYKVSQTSFTRMHVENNSNPDKPVVERLKFSRFIIPVGVKYYALKNQKFSVSAFGGINLIMMNSINRAADFYLVSFPTLSHPATHRDRVRSYFNESESSMGLGYLAGIGATFNIGDVDLTADLQYRRDISKGRLENIAYEEEGYYFFTQLKWFELNFGIRF